MPLVPLACAWLAGVMLGALWPGLGPQQAGVALALAAGTALVLGLLWPDRRARWVAALAVAAWLGLARSLLATPPELPPANTLRALNVPAAGARSAAAPRTHVRGRVAGEPLPARAGRATQVRVSVDTVLVDGEWRPAPGDLLVVAGPVVPAGNGDLVECDGVIQDAPSFAGFDYRAWLARHGIGSYMDRGSVRLIAVAEPGPDTWLGRWRHAAGLRTAAMLPEPEAGLLRGILLGEGHATDGLLRQEFAASGTSWIIVVSGVHLSIFLVFGFLTLRRRFMPWPSIFVASAGTLAYALMVGMGVPVARAALMGVLYLGAEGFGRPRSTLNLLALAALVLTALDPLIVADAGFQLSFAAVAGIILFVPALNARWRRVPLLGNAGAVAVAVQLTTWPIAALQFGTFAPIAIPAGVLGGLLLHPILFLGAAQEVAAWLWAPAGQVLAWLCWLPLAVLAALIHFAAGAPGAALPLPDFGLLPLCLWYLGLGSLYICGDPGRRAAVALAVRPWVPRPNTRIQ